MTYIHKVLKRTHESFPTRNMDILSYERAVCRSGIETEKGFLDIDGK